MTGRIPMVGDPPPLDRVKLGREWADSVLRMHADAQAMLKEAEASGDKKQVREAQATLKKTQAMVDRMGG